MRISHALCLLIGICVGIFQRQLPSIQIIYFMAAAAGALVLVLMLHKTSPRDGAHKPLRGVLLFAAILLVGYSFASFNAHTVMAHRLRGAPATGAEYDVIATIVELPKHADRQTRLSLRLLTSQALGGVENVQVGYYGSEKLRAGERWQMRLKLRAVHGETNPGGFDFARAAAANRIDAVGYVLNLGTRQQDARGINALRERVSDQIASALPASRERALLQALSVGDTRGLNDADWDLMRASGITHLIAISGLHVTLLATLGAGFAYAVCWLFPTLTRRWPRPQVCAVVGLIGATLYALLAGFGVPAQRTLLMLAALLLGIIFKRIQSLWQGFALALTAVLLVDPMVVLSPGAWLSFGAVALLIIVFGTRFPKPGWWRELLGAQLLMTLGLLPLSLVFFGQAALAAPLANLVAVPLVSLVIVPLVLAATVLLIGAQAALATPLLKLAAVLWHGLLALLSALSKPAAMTLYFAPPSTLALALAAIGVLLVFSPRGVPLRYFGALLLAPMLLAKPPAPIPPGEFQLTLLDVGQGLSALVRTEHHALLFDAGPGAPEGANAGESMIVPSLRALGVARLDLIMVSHGDNDHAGGLAAVRRAFSAPVSTSAVAKISDSFACIAGQHWQWDGVEFAVLHPNQGLPYLANQSSCVLHIRSLKNAASALLPGDIDAVIEARLLRTQMAQLSAKLLIAPHHGSAGSSSAEFLAAVHPSMVLYPSGYANRFDFPRRQTRERVQNIGAEEGITGELGALHAEFDAASSRWKISSARAADPHWWR
jgi:competence protein ComEC